MDWNWYYADVTDYCVKVKGGTYVALQDERPTEYYVPMDDFVE